MIGHTVRKPASPRRLPLPALTLMTLLLPGAAFAQDARLAGRYAVAGTFSCLYAANGFGGNGVPNAPSSAAAASFSSSGVFTFDGLRRGSGKLRLVGLDLPPYPAADVQSISIPFSYTVGSNGAVTLSAANLSGRFLAPGPAAGATYTVDQLELHGWLAADNRSLTLATTGANVMTVTYANGAAIPEICGISEVLLQIGQ
jgi:hypothetical protein